MSDLVANPGIQAADLLVPKPLLFRPYVWPFTIIYPIFIQIYFQHYDKYIGGQEWTFVYCIAIISFNLLFWLMPHWNLDINAKFNYQKVDQIANAKYIKIIPAPNSGMGEICEINRETFHDGEKQVSFLYQKRRYLFHPELNKFSPPEFLFDELPQLQVFQTTKGLSGDLEKMIRNYGSNKFDIPVPTFLELFKEHAVAPFFVFQIFCVALWCMDEQWYYSLFSLFMLVTFEMTTVFQRRTTMAEFQSMGIKPYSVYAYRDKKWVEIETTQLLPGDLISVTRTSEGSALPCDLLLIDGSAIVNEAMLSGESTPLLKESIKLRPATDNLQPEGFDKNSILHGGTMALQVTPPESNPIVPAAPDHGALAVVTKTGFETSQGSLVRMMIFSSERVSVGNKEAFLFILFLLIFAIAASWYVWVEGTKMGRIQSKLILDCIIVITSVVPPELPMELTMAVNSSLSKLQKQYVYCTEPFRIPLAGRIDVCCFDKTGTLTAEDLVFEGLAGFNVDDIHHLYKGEEAPENTTYVLGAAHALVRLDDGEVVGDPMEQATLKAVHWQVGAHDTVEKKNGGTKKIKILRRFQFSSALKRMSSISSINGLYGKNFVAAKGAPETIRTMIVDAPDNYEEIYKSFTRSGSRVLALAYKHIDASVNVNKVKREDIESNLHFAGFIVFHCPLKDDAIKTIKMLNESSHRSVMITGDNPLTACHVAKEVAIVTKDVLILDAPEEHHEVQENENLVWRNVDESIVIPFNSNDKINTELFANYDICITGHALNYLSEHEQILEVLKHTWVYARVSPSQKEFILTSLKDAGYNTLMCGDGTNDVGALKQAHIGVALLNGTEEGMKKLIENRKMEATLKVYEKQVQLLTRWGKPPPPVPPIIAHLYPPGPSNPKYLEAMEKKGVEITEEMKKAVDAANKAGYKVPAKTEQVLSENKSGGGGFADTIMGALDAAESEDEVPVLKLGDASVAAPFTSKLSNVSAVTHIIREGRCALVSTIQMYKILALNCLISAYSLSVLYLAGIKFGDGQATISGILLSVCFLSISRGRPLEKLSKQRPQDGIFNIYIMGSILGQFAIHIITLIYITREIYILEPREPQVDLEKEFSPSLLNTGMFLLQLAQQVSTFAVNYIGLPFRESIKDNKGMYYGLLGVAGLALAGSTEFMPELNEAMQFVKMTSDFKVKLTGSILVDLGATWLIESTLKHFFMNSAAADIAKRDDDGEEVVDNEKLAVVE
ncbi:SPF1 [[Candida] subhashii]|uniref:SPF1 n=1 Tax=[Candida] subhashii TaxID=561895 RepID=A0A8J5QIP1_9ASCO|nr:SPF1 [[Candida] subhashii]KAG7661463.1 SPF1 [[Candida] subhashii]